MTVLRIESNADGNVAELRLAGRLDNEGAEQFTMAVDETVRLGNHAITVDLAEVEYISSAGIGALIKARKQLRAVHGSFQVVATSPQVAEAIRLTGVGELLLGDRPAKQALAGTSVAADFRLSSRGDFKYELYGEQSKSSVVCELFGDPQRLSGGDYPASQCRAIGFSTTSIGLGLGAFGQDHAACANRFGEFLAAGGTAIHQAPSGHAKPDFQRVMGDFVPEVQTLYGLRCQGDLSRLVRFDRVDDGVRIPLSGLIEQVLSTTDCRVAAIAILAESTGLIGARLRQSPAPPLGAATRSRFDHPEIRDWLEFTPEQTFSHELALITGIATRGDPGKLLAPFVRQLAPTSDIFAHFHAATFSYRPFKKRRLDLVESVATLCEEADLLAVRHLLHDDRSITGGGESEFARGACWIGPIADIRSEGASP